MRYIYSHLSATFFMLCIVLPIFILIRLIQLRRKKQKPTLHDVGLLCFVACVTAVLSSMVFPGFSEVSGKLTLAPPGFKANLIPFQFLTNSFKYLSRDLYSLFTINIIGPIAIFVPIGLLLPLLWRGFSLKNTLLSVLPFAIVIEAIQYFLPRYADIDDVILYMVGTLLGYLCYKLFCKRVPNMVHKLHSQLK